MATSTLLSRKLIKLLSPTPPSLRLYNLSLMDCTNPPQYSPVAFFYPKPQNCNKIQISQILENSLSKVLTSYYPFAGRIKDNNTYVECNDTGAGAEYLNVRISCPMSEILDHPYNDVVDVVFPQDVPWGNALNRSPLVLQLSHFDCGGIAVSICLSHKLADGYSLHKFVSDWAATARQVDFKPSSQFNASTFFPLKDDPPVFTPINAPSESRRHVSRIYNFSSSSLGRLKDIVAVQNPTRIEVATALIHKCGVNASMQNSGVFKPTLLSHAMNLRPPIPLNTIGNATCLYSSKAMMEDDIKLSNYVARLRKAKQQVRDELKSLDMNQTVPYAFGKVKELVGMMERDIFDIYICTSVCNIELYKITNFGWGSPIRVTQPGYPMKKSIVILDDPSGKGINALITLPEDDMSIFHNNKELLDFASPIVESTK
nr:acylinositol acyltransferase [Solanum quitoense]